MECDIAIISAERRVNRRPPARCFFLPNNSLVLSRDRRKLPMCFETLCVASYTLFRSHGAVLSRPKTVSHAKPFIYQPTTLPTDESTAFFWS